MRLAGACGTPARPFFREADRQVAGGRGRGASPVVSSWRPNEAGPSGWSARGFDLLLLPRMPTDDGQVVIRVPEDDVSTRGLGTGGDEEGDRPPAVAVGLCMRELALEHERPLDGRLRERQPRERRPDRLKVGVVCGAVLGSDEHLERDRDAGRDLSSRVSLAESGVELSAAGT